MGADVVVGAAIMSFSTSAGFVANTTRPSFVAYGTAAAWSDTPPIDAAPESSAA